MHAAPSSPPLSDRELDAAVAERVMGWEHPRQATLSDLDWRDPVTGQVYFDGDHDRTFCLPWFSTDIAAAWRVVERMIEAHDLHLSLLSDFLDEQSCDAWHARFADAHTMCCDEIGCMPGCATAATAPRAICEAALAALESR